MEVRQHGHKLAILFLWERPIFVIRTQSCLHVGYRDLQIECSQRSSKSCRGIALDNQQGRTFPLQNRSNPLKNPNRNIKGALVRIHDIEVVVGHNIKQVQYFVQHLSVLSSCNDHWPKGRQVFA